MSNFQSNENSYKTKNPRNRIVSCHGYCRKTSHMRINWLNRRLRRLDLSEVTKIELKIFFLR